MSVRTQVFLVTKKLPSKFHVLPSWTYSLGFLLEHLSPSIHISILWLLQLPVSWSRLWTCSLIMDFPISYGQKDEIITLAQTKMTKECVIKSLWLSLVPESPAGIHKKWWPWDWGQVSTTDISIPSWKGHCSPKPHTLCSSPDVQPKLAWSTIQRCLHGNGVPGGSSMQVEWKGLEQLHYW